MIFLLYQSENKINVYAVKKFYNGNIGGLKANTVTKEFALCCPHTVNSKDTDVGNAI